MWYATGYPNDFIPAGQVPVVRGPSAIQGYSSDRYGDVYDLDGIATHGDSGGPVYVTLSPHKATLIGVMAITQDLTIYVHGGIRFNSMIERAIEEYP